MRLGGGGGGIKSVEEDGTFVRAADELAVGGEAGRLATAPEGVEEAIERAQAKMAGLCTFGALQSPLR